MVAADYTRRIGSEFALKIGVTMARDESVTVKGSPVRSLQKFLEAELTPAQRDAVLASLPPAYAARLRGIVLATEIIPVYILNVMTEEAARARGERLDAFARRAGREGAADALKGIYRFFAMVMTPGSLLGRASQMWSSLYNRGAMRVETQTDRSAVIKLVDFPSEAAGCARVTGWIERMGEMTGAKEVRVQHVQCAAKGAPQCEWTITWK
jgi:predicted hydrocarbon binding protein